MFWWLLSGGGSGSGGSGGGGVGGCGMLIGGVAGGEGGMMGKREVEVGESRRRKGLQSVVESREE